ncbi:hypothetical protein WIW50_11445 [Flavobacteriaceae bacterium 3-367]|uniref:hypothetical protein n=1 Tax=Eudoraea algarum TaxID=3417568 RepID=UPI00328F59D9
MKEHNNIFHSPEIQGILNSVNEITGQKLSDEYSQSFSSFRKYTENYKSTSLADWPESPKLKIWYRRLAVGILIDVRSSFCCVNYHYERIEQLEKALIDSIDKFDYKKLIGESSIKLGDTKRIDFEYQAFVLAYRRCLDLLTRAISARFKNDFHSFRKLDKFLENFSGDKIADELILTHNKFSSQFEFVMSSGNRKSIRDKISHYEYVPALTFNLNKSGMIFFGGGENMRPNFSNPEEVSLSYILKSRLDTLNICISEMINILIND